MYAAKKTVELLNRIYPLRKCKTYNKKPCLYYHIGQYSQHVKAYGEAISMYNHCLLISPSYTPAKDRLNEMKEKNQT